MSKLLVNYAFATALYSAKRDFLETFSPFVLKSLYDFGNVMTDIEIIKQLESDFKLKLPINTLRTILKKLNKDAYIKVDYSSKSEWKAIIVVSGKKEIEDFVTEEKQIQRKHQELFNAIKEYLKEHGVHLEIEQIEEKVLLYINSNLTRLAVFESDISIEQEINEIDDALNQAFTAFFCTIEKKSPVLYNTFEELVKGAIVFEHISNREELKKESSWEPLSIYLDANFILSILGFHHPIINDAAVQLYNLLSQERKITLRVFSMTLEEISRLLKSYKYHKDHYNPNIGVNSIFFFLKQKKYDDPQIDNLLANLDKIVEKKHIVVEKKELVEIEKLKTEDKELYKDIYSFKKDLNEQKHYSIRKEESTIHISALHDALVISSIKTKRGAWVKNIERSKAIFLTSSYTLNEFCKKRYRTLDNFPEVILDLVLTNILWLKNPQQDVGIQLHKLISIHSKKFLINNGIWKRFVSTLKELHDDGQINQEQYAALFSNNQLTIEYLKTTDPEDITPESVSQLSHEIEKSITQDIKSLKEFETKIKEQSALISKQKQELRDLKKEKADQDNGKYNEMMGIIKDLQYERDRDKYIDQRMDEEFYPLNKKALYFLLAFIIGGAILYLAELLDAGDLQNLGVSFLTPYIKIIRLFGLLLIPFIYSIIAKIYKKDFWRFLFNRRKLKKEYEAIFAKDFESRR